MAAHYLPKIYIRQSRIICVLGFFLLDGPGLIGQDLENIGEKKFLATSGGISLSTTFYDLKGAPSRRDPIFWQLNANLNFSILGIIQAPFSLNITQQNKSFSQPQPFNRFGISPTYKEFTLHLGHRSLNFSDYTLAGNIFFGVGGAYEPENNPVRVQMMYGRFAKPVSRFAEDGQVFALPTYRRIGYGTKVGFQHKGQESHIILFHGRDDPGSISYSDSLDLKPEENLVIGWVGNFQLSERVSWSSEYAFSMFTRNITNPEVLIDEFTFVNNLGNLFTPRSSSSYSHAVKSRFSYSSRGFIFNIDYRRVDPDYTTHGSSFLNNDFEDITAGTTIPFFTNRLQVSGRVGAQHNNLDKSQSTTIKRFVYSSGITFQWTPRLQTMLNYSNFNSSTRQTIIQRDILIDTLEFVQVTRNASMNVNYNFGPPQGETGISFSSNWQDVRDNGGTNSVFSSFVLSFQKNLFTNWNGSISFTTNKNETNGSESLTTGPVINITRSFHKGRYRMAVGGNQLHIRSGGKVESNVTTFRLMNSGKLTKRQSVSLNLYYVKRHFRGELEKPDVNEFRATLNYSFRL